MDISSQPQFPSFHQPSSSPPARRAVIDVGTNSIKLLVADVSGHVIDPITEESKQTRLGRGFYETHILQPEAIAQTAEAVAAFAETARHWKAESIRVIATSAARDALNPEDLTGAIERVSALKVEIISGEQEADWVFHGVTSNPSFADQALLILDVGGGSTEFILGENSLKHYRQSHRLGTVRLLEELRPDDPPGPEALSRCRSAVRKFLDDKLTAELEPALRACVHQPVQLIGTGGTTTILARIEKKLPRFDREEIEAARLSLDRVKAQCDRLWAMSIEERKQIVGLPAKRADVIITGVVIFEAVMERFGFPELRVSSRGLRYAALMV